MKLFLLIIFIFIHSFSSESKDHCQRDCKTLKIVKLCLVDPAENQSTKEQLTVQKACGEAESGNIIKEVSTQDQLKEELKRIHQDCGVIKEMTIFGHSDGMILTTGNMETRDFNFIFNEYRCLFSHPNPRVNLIACDAGVGCAGRLLMYQMAAAVFPDAGNVRAPMSGCLASPLDISSQNGKWAELTYVRRSNRSEWTESKGFFGSGEALPSIQITCLEEINLVLRKMNDKEASCVKWDSKTQRAYDNLVLLKSKLQNETLKVPEIFPPGTGVEDLEFLKMSLDCENGSGNNKTNKKTSRK